jgi:glycosyltransferase involved in cell wall biosynthesis
MHVLLVSANFRPHVGGIERFTETLAAGLARRGHEVTVLCCGYGGAPPDEVLDGFEIRRVPASHLLDRRVNVPYPLPTPASLLRRLKDVLEGAEVVHVQDALYATSVAALALARRRGVPSVLTQHVALVPQQDRRLDALQRFAIASLGRSARLANLVATYNPAVARWVEEQWGIRDARVLPVGVESGGPPGDRVELRRSFGLPSERFVALFVGRDVPKKGLDIFLAASDPLYELVAVTDRPPPAPSATVLPFMSPVRLQALLACVDAFVLPSEGEGFPIALQEALARGLPVVAAPGPGYDHYLSPDDVLFVEREPGSVRDALTRLATDEELRRRLAERSRAAAERHFGVERFVSAYEELYDEAIGRAPRPSRASSRKAPGRHPG